MWYLKSAFDTYQKVQDAVQNRLSDVQSAILSPVDVMKRFLGGNPAPREEAGEELDALRKRVAELEARLKAPKPAKARARAKRSRV